MFLIRVFLLISTLLYGCSGVESSENRRIRKLHEKEEKIYRRDTDKFFPKHEILLKRQEPYPWERKKSGPCKITEDFFRCRGSCIHPKKRVVNEKGRASEIEDCGGEENHSTPLGEKRVAIAPILITLLNYIQEKTKERVIITTGYRCPEHNRYSDLSKRNETSKHQKGLEVDFYVETYEENPREIVLHLMQYYGSREEGLSNFIRQKNNERNLRHPGFCNKEIALFIHEKDEGRDFDNRHPYPYITIEVREGK